jgi:1-acyl-sn-glycerol-3-phosphate acyltransferase
MKILKKGLIVIWRIWFYFWVLFSIVPLIPILLIVISREKWYKGFFTIARFWAKTILFMMGFRPVVEFEEKINPDKGYLFCPNHTSMIDIMLMLVVTKNPFVFIGKSELAKLPLFGFFYKKTNILVDRTSMMSRKKAFDEANRKLKMGISVCIFPEGLVPDEHIVLSDFKSGAFRLGIELKVPIVPITFFDCKKRFSYSFFTGSPGKLRVKIHKFIQTENLEMKDRNLIKEKTFNIIYKSLIDNLEKEKK